MSLHAFHVYFACFYFCILWRVHGYLGVVTTALFLYADNLTE